MYQNFAVRTHLLFLGAFFQCAFSIAQIKADSPLVDSLKRQIALSSGKAKYELVYKVAYELYDVDNVEAVKYADEAHFLAKELGDSLAIVMSGRIRGQLLRRVGRLEDAISQLSDVLSIAKRNRIVSEEKRILNALAATYTYSADYGKALEFNFRSLEIREQEGDKKEISIALNNIGIVYFKILNFEQALYFYNRSLQAKQGANDTYDLDRLLINIGLCYNQLRDYVKAQEFISEAFKLCQENCDDQIIIEGEFGLGISYLERKEYQEAGSHFNKSYAISEKIGDKRFQAENSLYLGSIELQNKNYVQAAHILKETESLSETAGYNQILINTYKRFSRLYNETMDFEKAALYQSKYIQLKDSIYSEELIKNLARVQTNYEERENIKTIAEKNEILRLNQLVIARQKQVYFFVALVAILSLLLTYTFLRYNRALGVAKQLLSVMNQTLERRVEDRTKALQNVNNELDNFIYKTSHDIRGPLASLKGIANVALMELKDVKAQDYLHKLDASADKLNSILTRLLIVNQINHAVLSPQQIDFTELISEILVFERKKGIPSRMSILHEVDPDVTLVTDRHILRIILENLIDNAIKYYNSSERIEPFVKIKVELQLQGILIRVIDNGIGIQGERDPQKLFQMFVRASERSESGGIGLYLTKLATERLFAKVDFTTTVEKYTQFSVIMPENLNVVLEEKEAESV